jgi:hypothetical protein
VGLADEPLQGEVVGEESGAVFGLVRVGGLFSVGCRGLCRCVAVVGGARGLGRVSASSNRGVIMVPEPYEVSLELSLAHFGDGIR